ncbi:MAG TPA: hypothetical protein VF838_01290 [Trebonia sp.]
MSFASEPGRDDGNLPPVNIVIPDDARELDRDVLAYRREMRARRRRQRLMRFFQPFRTPEFGGHAAVIPLIAICLAICLVGGALLSVATMSPASAPTLNGAQGTARAVPTGELTELPGGSVQVAGRAVPVRSLTSSVIALVPANCDCGLGLQRLAGQATGAHAKLYFAADGQALAQLAGLTTRYGDGTAVAAADSDGVLTGAYRPSGLTVLLVFKDATAKVLRNLTVDFQLTPVMRELGQAGAVAAAGPSAVP